MSERQNLENLLAFVKSFLALGDSALTGATLQVVPKIAAIVDGYHANIWLMRAANSGRIPRRGLFLLNGGHQRYWVHGSGYSFHIDGAPIHFDLLFGDDCQATGDMLLSPWKLSQFIRHEAPGSPLASQEACTLGLESLADLKKLTRKSPDWLQFFLPDSRRES